jgi:hypothetical protein
MLIHAIGKHTEVIVRAGISILRSVAALEKLIDVDSPE